MYVTREILAQAEAVLGSPTELHMAYEITPDELAMIRRSQRHGRAHDVTTCMLAGDRVAVIAKHNYPQGMYRIPGGGLEPGESLLDGAVREALEETGLPYTIARYLLRVDVAFTCGVERIDWMTHIVTGTAPFTVPAPLDLREIREARWMSLEDLQGPVAERMLATGRPLFAYRVALHQATVARLL
ncbi:MAG TPA: NUDIX hydrolase [Chloroflexota bacterium]|nr:NUDIX hydrolase [Chloroflexota bacterium]